MIVKLAQDKNTPPITDGAYKRKAWVPKKGNEEI